MKKVFGDAIIWPELKIIWCKGRGHEWGSSNPALGYFASKVISQQHKILDKKSVFIIFSS